MPTNTPNLNLIKPLVTEYYSVEVANSNNDTLDGILAPYKTNGQIKFPATQIPSADANTLDDYEEGTFTPFIYGTTTAGVGTYSSQKGFYTKIGNLVYITIYLEWSAHTGTGNMYIGGLPFTSKADIESRGSLVIGDVQSITLTANNYLTSIISQASTFAFLFQNPVGGGSRNTVPIDTAGWIRASGSYLT